MKFVVLFFFVILTTETFANRNGIGRDSHVGRDPSRGIKILAQEILDEVDQVHLSTTDLREIRRLLGKANAIIKGTGSPGPGPDPTPIPQPQSHTTATCIIDDDSDVNQETIGTLVGLTTIDVMEECKFLAETFFPRTPYFALKNTQVHSGPIGLLSATCTIDDDIDVNQETVGKMFGQSTLDLHNQCLQLAQMKFGQTAYMKISNLQFEAGPMPTGFKAKCMIDDDRDVNQVDMGTLFAPTPADIQSECHWLAVENFGESLAHSKVTQLEVQQDPVFLQATCMIDDDPRVDQVNAGPVQGASTMAMHQQCFQLAKMQFGSKAHFKLKNLSVQ